VVAAAELLQYLANGIGFGAILALAAIGLSLVYGILNLSNFAHGDFVALGAFMTLLFATVHVTALPFLALGLGAAILLWLALDVWRLKRLDKLERAIAGGFATALLVLGAAMLATGERGPTTTELVLVTGTAVAIGAVVAILLASEFLIWRPLRAKRATTLTLIIVSIGLSLVVRNALQVRFGGGNHNFSRPGIPSDRIFGILVSDAQQFTIVTAIVAIVGVHLLLRYTRAGKAMRALADNAELARVTGIDVDRMVIYVWILSAALVTIAGVLLTLVQNNIMNVHMGFGIIIALFASVIVGGIGSAYGAMLGGFIVGIAMKTSASWIGTEYELASAFMILIIVLIVRPQGILGVKT
jgi:branched-subunit amino acid ABC-type transport system permease component